MTLATTPAAPTAVIAEDEPVLARTLTRLLEQVWPELRIVADFGLFDPELAILDLAGELLRRSKRHIRGHVAPLFVLAAAGERRAAKNVAEAYTPARYAGSKGASRIAVSTMRRPRPNRSVRNG